MSGHSKPHKEKGDQQVKENDKELIMIESQWFVAHELRHKLFIN